MDLSPGLQTAAALHLSHGGDTSIATWTLPTQCTQILEILASRHFEDLLHLDWLPHVLSQTCVLCGANVPASQMNSNVDDNHTDGQIDYWYILPDLIRMCDDLHWIDGQRESNQEHIFEEAVTS